MRRTHVFWMNFLLIDGCRANNKDQVLSAINDGANDWSTGLQYACEGGHKEMAILMIEKGADLEWGLEGACYKGHKDMALFMIEQGANNWNWALDTACMGGRKELALLMVEKGADISNCSFELDMKDIERLYKMGIKIDQKNQPKLDSYKVIEQEAVSILSNFLIDDMAGEIIKY